MTDLTADAHPNSAVPPIAPGDDPEPSPQIIYRHRLPVRLWHWINAAMMIGLFMSGLMIFNAHPRLYWGDYGANPDPAWLEINDIGARGFLRLGQTEFTTTGVLGVSTNREGNRVAKAFPNWITLPTQYDLAGARRYHLTFAWVFGIGFLLYFLWTVLSRRITRDFKLTLHDLSPRHVWQEVKDHARLRFPTGAAAARYNRLQKITYVVVLFLLLPLIILTGVTMSPTMDAAWPWLLDLFGGRQSARSLHFIACWLLFAFFVVHILMVLLAGPVNELRSMLSGWFVLPPDRTPVAGHQAREIQ